MSCTLSSGRGRPAPRTADRGWWCKAGPVWEFDERPHRSELAACCSGTPLGLGCRPRGRGSYRAQPASSRASPARASFAHVSAASRRASATRRARIWPAFQRWAYVQGLIPGRRWGWRPRPGRTAGCTSSFLSHAATRRRSDDGRGLECGKIGTPDELATSSSGHPPFSNVASFGPELDVVATAREVAVLTHGDASREAAIEREQTPVGGSVSFDEDRWWWRRYPRY